jgi:hypothetical protein
VGSGPRLFTQLSLHCPCPSPMTKLSFGRHGICNLRFLCYVVQNAWTWGDGGRSFGVRAWLVRKDTKKKYEERVTSSRFNRLDGTEPSPGVFSFLFSLEIPSDMDLGSRLYPLSGPLSWDSIEQRHILRLTFKA